VTISDEESLIAARSTMRGIILVIFLFGALSAGVELLLLGHTESPWQWVPLVLIMASLIVLIIHAAARRAASVRVFQGIMFLFIISGFAGSWQHYQTKVEFKLETNPALGGMELFWEVITGATVPPVLAPGVMIQLGLLGLAYTFRHPVLISSAKRNQPVTTGE
jgi:hypothetical protein